MVLSNNAATWVAGKTETTIPLPTVQATDGQAANRYQEIEEINRGGCGMVLRAYDRHLQCEVALKRMLPELANDSKLQTRFFHEARVTARLAHPGIAPIHDVGQTAGSPYYTMKWLRGQTLADLLKDRSQVQPASSSFRELLIRFRHVCQTLSFAHERGIVHRDLKPSNILIAQYGETIVLDWGLAKELGSTVSTSCELVDASTNILNASSNGPLPSESALTTVGSVLGTVAYMSPEQAAGQLHLVDQRSDVFALGVILYEILTGTSPFRCPTQQETLQHTLRCEYRPLKTVRPRLPVALVAICETALQHDPNARYAHAGEMERDIQAWLAGESVSAFREPWWFMLDRLANKYRTIFWSVLVSLLCIASISIVSTLSVTTAHWNERRARTAAESAHAEAVQALSRERVSHQEAVTQLQEARASIDGWLLGLDSVLALYPGLSPLRNQLFHQAIDYYTLLSDQAAESDVVRLEVIRAKIRLADLQRLNHCNDDARQNYHQAIEQLQTSVQRVRDWQSIASLQLATALLGLSQIDVDENKLATVHNALDQVTAIGEHFTESSPQFRQACELIAKAKRLNAMAYRREGRLDPAKVAINAAVTLYESCVLPSSPVRSTTQERQDFLAMLDELAEVYFAAHAYAEADDAVQRSIHFYDRLLATDPERPDWLEARALARLRSGWAHTQLVQPQQAIAELEASEHDLQNAWQLFKGEQTYLSKLAQVYNALGHSYFVGGDLEQAQQLLTRSLHSMTHRPDHQRDGEGLARWIQTRLYLATIQLRGAGRLDHHLDEVEAAIEALLPRAAQFPSVLQSHVQFHWLKAQILLQTDLNDATSMSDRITQAEQTLQHAITWQEQLPAEYQDACWHFWLGRLYSQYAIVAAGQHRVADTETFLQRAREHWTIAYNSTDKRWSAHAAFELFESLHASKLERDSELAINALQMARETVRAHETLPAAWFWLAELALDEDEIELAVNAQEKLARLRRRETLEDRFLKAVLQCKISQDFDQSLLDVPCLNGSHAAYLQRQLKQLAHNTSAP